MMSPNSKIVKECDKIIATELTRLGHHLYHPSDRVYALDTLTKNEKSYFFGLEILTESWDETKEHMEQRISLNVFKDIGT